MIEASRAIFLSYASQDAEAAGRLCVALREAGIDVWFDQNELRGGDQWDQTIRQRLYDCRLFIPLISASTEARPEGYFRREWRLAVERTRDMSDRLAFIVPVVIDATPEAGADVPEAFRAVQWTRLSGGELSATFLQRLRGLLSPNPPNPSGPVSTTSVRAEIRPANPASRRWPRVALVLATLLALAFGYVAFSRFGFPKHEAAASTSAVSAPKAPAVSFNPPPHSIAVLPFVNLSGDKEQEYFSDGLTEEMLNSLVRINQLQVAARTSSFTFKGKEADIATIAHKLNVAAVLEGSVRRGGNTVRVTVELTDTVSGFHLWSESYDRNLSDVLKLQTEIASAVTTALKVALLGNVAKQVEMGGTRVPSALDAYLRATKTYRGDLNEHTMLEALAGYDEAIRLDPGYALAYAERSLVLIGLSRNYASGSKMGDYNTRALHDAHKAIALAPDLAASHLALASILEHTLDFRRAAGEFARALALGSGDTNVLGRYGKFEVLMGHAEAGLNALRRAVALDPLNADNYFWLGEALVWARRPREALASLNEAKALEPDDRAVYGWFGFAYLQEHDYEHAREACEQTIDSNKAQCLAMAYQGLGRHAEAQAMLQDVFQGEFNGSVLTAIMCMELGDKQRALDLLEHAAREKDPYLEYLKVHYSLDPLRGEPSFQAIMTALNFPD